jgi:hypothetical protein
MCCKRKNSRIIFSLTGNNAISKLFSSAATAMPEAECLFLGFSWTTGYGINKFKLKFKSTPIRHIEAELPQTIPHLSDFVGRGYSNNAIPDSAKKSFASVKSFVEGEFDRFTPDVVVTGPYESVISYLLCESAKARSIPTITIQTSFMSDYYIIHSQGYDWIDYLTSYQIPEPLNAYCTIDKPVLRLASGSRSIWEIPTFIRGVERLLRLAVKGVSFDTWGALASRAVEKISQKKWFPSIRSLESIEDIESDYVLLALNQPALTPSDSPTWIDLVTLALEATPEEIPIIVRPHPSEPARDLPTELENALSSRTTFISRAGHGPSLPLIIQHCRAVLTLNSAIGMDALLEGKLVFTFCPAFYARPGMAYSVKASDIRLIRQMLMKHAHYQPDSFEVMKFVQWLMSEHVVSTKPTSSDSLADKSLVRYINNVLNKGDSTRQCGQSS